MIDAGPSLQAAEGLRAADVLTYLTAAGWSVRPSRVEGISIIWKEIKGADRPAEFILPVKPGFDEERRRVADALRTVAAVEGKDIASLADEIRLATSIAAGARSTDRDAWSDIEVEIVEIEVSVGPLGSHKLTIRNRMGEQKVLSAPILKFARAESK